MTPLWPYDAQGSRRRSHLEDRLMWQDWLLAVVLALMLVLPLIHMGGGDFVELEGED